MTATTMETKQRPWWMMLVGGIIAVIVGAVLLWAPMQTKAELWVLLTAMLGIYSLFGLLMVAVLALAAISAHRVRISEAIKLMETA